MTTPRAELRLALIRYERCASMPRHLQFSVVPSMEELDRAIEAALDRDDDARATELLAWREAEFQRRERVASWRGRDRWVWSAIRDRLAAAIRAVVWDLARGEAPVSPGELESARARLRDAEQRLEHCISVRERTGKEGLA